MPSCSVPFSPFVARGFRAYHSTILLLPLVLIRTVTLKSHTNLDVSGSQTVMLMLEVLGRVDVLDTDKSQCCICSLMDTSISSEEGEDEASGTLENSDGNCKILNIGVGRQCHQSDWLISQNMRVLALLHNQTPQ